MVRTRMDERALWRNKRQILKKYNFTFTTKLFIYFLCLNKVCLQFFRTRPPKFNSKYLVSESHCNTDGNTFSYSSYDLLHLITDNTNAISFFYEKNEINLLWHLQIDDWNKFFNLSIAQDFVLKLLVPQLPKIILHDQSDTQQLESIYRKSVNFTFFNNLLKYQEKGLN